MDLPRHRRLISSSGPSVQNEQLRVDGVRCQGALITQLKIHCLIQDVYNVVKYLWVQGRYWYLR